MGLLLLSEDLARGRSERRNKICIAGPNIVGKKGFDDEFIDLL